MRQGQAGTGAERCIPGHAGRIKCIEADEPDHVEASIYAHRAAALRPSSTPSYGSGPFTVASRAPIIVAHIVQDGVCGAAATTSTERDLGRRFLNILACSELAEQARRLALRC